MKIWSSIRILQSEETIAFTYFQQMLYDLVVYSTTNYNLLIEFRQKNVY